MAPQAHDDTSPATPTMPEEEARAIIERYTDGMLVSLGTVDPAQRDRLMEQMSGKAGMSYFRALEESVFLDKPTPELRACRDDLTHLTGLSDTQMLVYFEERITPPIKRFQTQAAAVAREAADAKADEFGEEPEETQHADETQKRTRRRPVTAIIGTVVLEHLPIHPGKPTPAGYFSPQAVQELKKDPNLREWYDAIAIVSSCEDSTDPRHAPALERQIAAKAKVAERLGLDVDSQVMARLQTSLARAAEEERSVHEI